MFQPQDVNVLIAEDELYARELLRELLNDTGYNVVGEATDGKEAVSLAMETHPDIILMDIRMPEMNGIEAMRAIWEKRPTPVIILTAFDRPEYVNDATIAGASAFLTKPVQRGEINRAIQVAVARFKDFIRVQNQNTALQTALKNIKSLNGIVHICANCKRVRDEESQWLPIELYIEYHSDVSFSHGLCPDCAELLYPQFFKEEQPGIPPQLRG